MAKRKLASEEALQNAGSSTSEPEESQAREEGVPWKKRTARIDRSDSLLLRLPPELRNDIYRFALLETDRIEVMQDRSMQPALLRTCCQLRKEASTIFNEENKFSIQVHALRPRLPAQHWGNTKVADGGLSMTFSGAHDWSNLRDWLMKYHAEGYIGIGIGIGGNLTSRTQVAAHAFRIVEEMIGTPWPVVEKVLEQYKKGTELSADGLSSWS